MKPFANSKIAPIAFAESASTAVSVGALMVMQRNPALIQPVRDWVTRSFVLPEVKREKPRLPEAEQQKLANDRASLLVKGVGMVGAGFTAHIPIELALHGEFHAKGLKTVVFGKSAGLAGSLGSIFVIDKLAPNLLPSLQNALYPLVKPLLPKDERGRESRGAEEVAKLLIIDIPSSIAAGLINYNLARKGR